jgi:hypothetical protein
MRSLGAGRGRFCGIIPATVGNQKNRLDRGLLRRPKMNADAASCCGKSRAKTVPQQACEGINNQRGTIYFQTE